MECDSQSYYIHTVESYAATADSHTYIEGWTKPEWVEGGICYPYCLPPQIYQDGVCVCEDLSTPNDEGYCCPGNH
jgi:hypothetical protein